MEIEIQSEITPVDYMQIMVHFDYYAINNGVKTNPDYYSRWMNLTNCSFTVPHINNCGTIRYVYVYLIYGETSYRYKYSLFTYSKKILIQVKNGVNDPVIIVNHTNAKTRYSADTNGCGTCFGKCIVSCLDDQEPTNDGVPCSIM